ncbi:MAG: trypsin-like serine protease [Proteobacteria bacterium]|nr:trypsin-like serine protease [Pseudomonadota bacterium]
MDKLNFKLLILAAVCCTALPACDDAALPEDGALAFTTDKQAILYGAIDEGDKAVVGIFNTTKIEDGKYFGNISCTGTLIHPSWVLTAGHCVADNAEPTATAKSNNKDKMIFIGTKNGGGTVYHIAGAEYIYWPKQYSNAIDKGYDIALIKLKNPISDAVTKPILPHPKWLPIDNSKLPAQMKVVGFGYDENGVSETKRQITRNMTFYCGSANPSDSKSGCFVGNHHVQGCHPNKYYCDKQGNYDRSWDVTINYGTFYNTRVGGGQCNGDSGGPSLYTMGGIQYVSAVTSWGDSPCRSYSVNTAVQDHYDWIISIAPEVATQYHEVCDNGMDDDGNGKTDHEDPACIFCGNNIVNLGEDCDGSHFSGDRTTCDAWDSNKYSGGKVTCNKDCTINYNACDPVEYCGDGKLSDGEDCDGSLFINNYKSCSDYDIFYTTGSLKCTKDCKIDTSACKSEARCGDGTVNGTEVCDGTKFYHNRTACNTIFPDLYSSGKVTCNNKCEYDTSACVAWCGNGSLNKVVGEVCDGEKFGGATCETLVGPGSKGSLKCVNECSAIDTSGCSKPAKCGDGVINGDEECDGTSFLGGKTQCAQWDDSYAKGSVSCNANCTINYTLCETGPSCGNGKLDDGELCDGTKFSGNKKACNTLFPDLYSSGTATCSPTCEYDTSACVAWCGNGSVNGKVGEVCDHGANGDKFTTSTNTCEKVVGKGSTGTLLCSDDCKSIITAGCSEPAFCGDNIVNNTEQCDGESFLGNKSTCAAWDSKYASGNVKCTKGCGLDFSDCILAPVCGDKKLDDNELCDTTTFKDNKTLCNSWDNKYASGRVTCTKDCQIDYSACKETVIVPDEICDNKIDDNNNGKIDCDDPECSSDETCKPKAVCGNGIVDGNEECDKTAFLLDETRCSEWILVFKSGTVTCNPDCTVNYDTCSTTIPEICDNKLDDNDNGRTDCDDYECVNFPACQAQVDPTPEEPVPSTPTQPDPVNPDPVNPDPVNPDPITPDPINPDTDTPDPITPSPVQPAKSSDDSDCSSMPLSPANNPLAALFLGILGLGIMRRRRHNS